jgi:hypothetical protein
MNILKILKPLNDGQWHQFDELTDKTILKKEIIVEIADSLEHYGFTELSKDKQAVRFKEDFLHL